MIENSNQGFGNPRQQGGLPSSNLTTWASSNCSAEGVGTDSACPGCNNSYVKSNANNPRGCGRGNPNNTIAPGWCRECTKQSL